MALVLVAAAWPVWGADPQDVQFFEQKIRPVLVERCYSCHSQEAKQNKKLKGELFLDTRDGLLHGGETGPSIVPGKSAESLLIKALKFDGLEMPPTGKLPDQVIADFAKWIDLGAADPRTGPAAAPPKREIDLAAGRQFWSFQPLHAHVPPEVKDAAWVRTPLDRFIIARQETQNIVPNALANKEKLARRAYYDLVGLPPSPEELDAFVQDASPTAYDQLIDRLLARPQYGERWGRHWLDAVRFAESGGYEFDGDRGGAFHYRDFVIRALNDDMPYDQFVRWQLAGDQLVPNDYLAASAAGFLVAGPYPGQITAKTVERIRYDQLDDMLSTVGGSMLGLTLGCVRCHDHKYDPIPQQDYYKLLSSISRVVSTDQKLDPQPEIYRTAKAAWDQAHAPLVAPLEAFEKDVLPARFASWRETELPKHADTKWLALRPVTATGKATLAPQPDASVRATEKIEAVDAYTFVAHTYQAKITALRIEALADAALPKGGPGLSPEGSFLLSRVDATVTPLDPTKPQQPVAVKLKPVAASFEKVAGSIAGTLDGDANTGWSIGDQVNKDHALVYEIEGDLGFEGGTVLQVVLKFEPGQFAIGRPRLSISTAERPAALAGDTALQTVREIKTLVEREQGQLNEKNRRAVLSWYRHFDPQADALLRAVEDHNRLEPKPNLATVFTVGQGGGDVFLLTRGEVDRKQGKAAPGFLQVLTKTGEDESRWLAAADPSQPPVEPRVALGKWLTDTDCGAGALLARVMVNRLWNQHFGRGLVGTPNDFGAQGEQPSHPELLDYLAGELVRGGWRLKPLHKLIMASSVYMQGNQVTPGYLNLDPENRLLWHRPSRRLEGEIIRDALLSISGTLDATMYGPGTLDDNVPRRSIYLTVKRSRLVPFLQMFDAPEPIQSIGVRSSTTVPTQALALMNSPFVRQRAEKLAARIRPAAGQSPEAAVDLVYHIALSRPATATERQRLGDFIKQQIDPAAAPAPLSIDQALVELCQAVICLNEFVYVD